MAALRKHVHSIEHMMCHEPKNPLFDVCNKANTQRYPKRKGAMDLGEKTKKFGAQVTGDMLIKSRTKTKDKCGPD